MDVTDQTAYSTTEDGYKLLAMLKHHCDQIRMQDLRPGDIPVMGQVRAIHVGIITDKFVPHGLIHVPSNGRCSEVVFDPKTMYPRALFRPRLKGAQPTHLPSRFTETRRERARRLQGM